MRKMLILSLLTLFLFGSLAAQDLEETLEELSGKAAQAYVGPIVSGFGTNLNGGWFHKSPKQKFLGLDFELGIVAMATPFKDEDDHFNTQGNFSFNYDQAVDIAQGVPESIFDDTVDAIMEQEFTVLMYGPTIIGPADEHVIIEFPTQTIIVNTDAGPQSVDLAGSTIDINEAKGLLEDFDFLPLIAPQLSIGTIYGTQLSLRYLPTYEIENLGEIAYLGFGLQHNPKAWLPIPIPVDFCLAAFTQSLDIGDIVTTNALSYGLNVSKTFGMRMLSVTPYAGYMAESCTMEFKYDYVLDITSNEINQIKFELESENTGRLTLGSSFRVGVFNMNVDYNMGIYNSVTAGFGLAF